MSKSGSPEKQPPGLEPRNLYTERFRGFENPLPRTDARCGEEVRGWHNRSATRGLARLFFRYVGVKAVVFVPDVYGLKPLYENFIGKLSPAGTVELSKLAGLFDSVALISLDKIAPQPGMAKPGWVAKRQRVQRHFGVPHLRRSHHRPSISQPFRAGLTFSRRPSGP